MRVFNLSTTHCLSATLAVLMFTSMMACKMSNAPTNTLLRDQSLPLFDPHMPTFTCEVEATKVPEIDAQADSWFIEARALEDPDTIEEDRDYKKIVELTRKAAERKHWKAMLNLASLYLENRDPARNENDALDLVEEAMRLGIPAGYDRMGTYYSNGTGVQGDTAKAHAFWLKAAQMGNPQAMTFLADKISATWDSPVDDFWANVPIATKMLECALGQGYGPAAERLSYLIAGNRPTTGRGNRSAEASARAVEVLHEGVKFGCKRCAYRLSVEFSGVFGIADILPPHVDKARAERYAILGDALGWNRDRRFPNLDRVLPLPPAQLPAWDGDHETLRSAAMGVKPRPLPSAPTSSSIRSGRFFLDAAFLLRHTGDKTTEGRAPRAGYWQPSGSDQSGHIHDQLAKTPAGLYSADEPFEVLLEQDSEARRPITGIVWERWDTQWQNHDAIQPRVQAGLARELERSEPILSCPAGRPCPATGVWQPWAHPAQPLSLLVNHHWRQAWLIKGQSFPIPEQDWLLPFSEGELVWYLLDDIGVRLI